MVTRDCSACRPLPDVAVWVYVCDALLLFLVRCSIFVEDGDPRKSDGDQLWRFHRRQCWVLLEGDLLCQAEERQVLPITRRMERTI